MKKRHCTIYSSEELPGRQKIDESKVIEKEVDSAPLDTPQTSQGLGEIGQKVHRKSP
jgi:hypothetical protein